MDERQVFNKRGVNLGVPIKQESFAPGHASLDYSWFQTRLYFVRRDLLKYLRARMIQNANVK